jgi:hypothetical protein
LLQTLASGRGGSVKPNPPPKKGKARPTVDLVLTDLRERKAMGIRKYGVAHQHDNGRDHLLDAYEEALDLAVYLRAELERRKPTS